MMNLEQITLEGFLSYKERQTASFDADGTYLVIGQTNGDSSLSNGSGKSSLFEAIPVAFWGKTGGRGDKVDDYINHDSDEMYIEVVFVMDDIRYKNVLRKSRKSSANHEIWYDKEGEWIKTDKSIDDVLGLGLKTYLSTVYLSEREAAQFIDGTGGDRKEIYRDLLNIQQFEIASKVAKKKADEVDKSIAVNMVVIEKHRDDIEKEDQYKNSLEECTRALKPVKAALKKGQVTLDEKRKEKKTLDLKIEKQDEIKKRIETENEFVKEFKGQIEDREKQIQETKKELHEQVDKYEKRKAEIQEAAKEIEELKAKRFEKKKELEQFEDVEQRQENAKNKLEEQRKLITGYTEKAATLNTQLQQILDLQEKVDKFGSVCPVTEERCPIINEEYREGLKEDWKKKAKELKKELDKTQADFSKLKEEIERLSDEEEKAVEDIKRKAKVERTIADITADIKELENEQEKFDESEKALTEYCKTNGELIKKLEGQNEKHREMIADRQKTIEELEAQIDKELISQAEKLDEVINSLEEELANLKSEDEGLEKQVAIITEKLKEVEGKKKQIQEIMERNEEMVSQKKVYLFLEKIFGRDGIQKTVMKQTVPFLERSTGELLKIFNNDSEKIKVHFDLDPKTASGELKKGGGLDILVLEEDREPKDLKMYSGGERVRSVFSVLLGLAKLLTMRSGKKHDTLIIDEKIAKLDRRGIEQFVEIIESITGWYKKIIVITHIEALKDMVGENIVIVNKTDQEGSLVTVK